LKRIVNRIPLVLIFIMVSLALFACSPGESPGAEGNTRVVVDQAGRTVELPQRVERVIAAYQPATYLVFALGANEKLVGVDVASPGLEFFRLLHPAIAQLPGVGSKKGLNMEEIAAAAPDVVILFPGHDSPTLAEQLAAQGIPSVIIKPESPELLQESILLLGDVLGEEEQAADLIAYYEEKRAYIQERVGGIPVQERPRVFLAGPDGVLSTCSGDLYQHYLIEEAGGKDVAEELSGGWNNVSLEQVIAWNPDIIVTLQYSEPGDPEEIMADPNLAATKAVQEKRVYRFPSNLGPWDYPEPRSILGVLWLAQKLYPASFADLDMEQEADFFHEKFYGRTFTELGGQLDGNS